MAHPRISRRVEGLTARSFKSNRRGGRNAASFFELTIMKVLAAVLMMSVPLTASADPDVKLSRIPGGGIQPKAVVDASGTTHLLSFQGESAGGDLFYRSRGKADRDFSQAVRVNSVPNSAVAIGSIRGGQFAIGKHGIVHVVWNGSRTGKKEDAPLFYTRRTAGGTFEPQRALSGDWIMDGGGAIAADDDGRVYVFYHGGRGTGEESRRVLVRVSDDAGETFREEKIISPDGMGVCACCSMQAFADAKGRLFVLYRAASDGGRNRDVMALFSDDHGVTWHHSVVSRWSVAACPMSSMSVSAVGGRIWMTWEKEGQIQVGIWNDQTKAVDNVVAMPGQPSGRKHPVIAASAASTHALVVWTEGTGWNRGGSVGWQLMSSDLQPSGDAGRAPGVDVWSFAAAVPLPNGRFEIMH